MKQPVRHTKWQIAQHWAQRPERRTFAPHLDLGEPCCFACGWYSERWDDHTAPETSWEHASLERAHIVPDSLGGSADVGNIILLCKPCHAESPDWADPSEMARWIAARPARNSRELETLIAWRNAAMEVPELAELIEAGDVSRLLGYMRKAAERASFHFGTGLSQGTRVAILRDAAHRMAQDDA